MIMSGNASSPALSILIVNWKSVTFLEQCLRTIYRETKSLSYEVIVVDNASFDGSEEMVHREFPQVVFVQSRDNLGFSRGNNLAFERSRGKYILFLNPDTEIVGDALGKLANCLESDSKAGVVGPKLLNSDGSLQTSCVQAFPTILNQAFDAEALRRLFPKASLWGVRSLYRADPFPEEVDVISGASLMIRREVFEKVGQFTTEYFMYAEDVDLCYKVHSAGWGVLYFAGATVVHHGGQSSGKKAESNFAVVMNRKSLYSFFKIRRGAWYAGAFRASSGLFAVFRLALLFALYCVTFGKYADGSLPASFSKWRSVFRWSVGLESIAESSAK